MEPTQLSADVKQVSFAAALAQLVRAQATGVLEIRDSIGLNRAFLLRGIPQGAKLSRLKHPIGRILTDNGTLTNAQLDEALAIHNKTEKLLGQVLLDLKLVNPDKLKQAMETQGRLNLLSLFGLSEGQMEFHDGLVHLTDFTPAPDAPFSVLYRGVRDHARDEMLAPFLARITFSALTLTDTAGPMLANVEPAEQMVAQLLRNWCFAAELARAVPLPPKALGALLYALNELGGLTIGPALKVARG